MQVQQKSSKLNPTHRFMEEVKKSTGYKELTEAVKFASDEFTNIGSVMKNKDLADKLYHFIAYYVAPTANSDFQMFNNAQLDSWKDASIPEAQKWLAIPEEDRSVPFRMIDLITGNLVETKNYGPMDQYCILSHSWKGSEIDYNFFARAQRSDERTKSKFGDVGAVASMAEEGAFEPRKKLQDLIDHSSECNELNIRTVDDMLKMHFELVKMEKDCISADKEIRQAIDLCTSATWETKHYQSYVAELHMGQSNSGEVKASQISQAAKEKLDDEITRLSKDAEVNASNIEKKRKKAYSTLEERQARTGLPMSDPKIRYAVEDLLQALYYRKSARKLLGAVAQANTIFKEAPFTLTRRRYLWLDNCCIKKSDGAELTESLARMGEWYANADFCLVHVDTTPDDDEWIQESKSVPPSKGDGNDPPAGVSHPRASEVPTTRDQENQTQTRPMDENRVEKPEPKFDDLITTAREKKKIHWATRGWTLQELVLSRVTYYFNSTYEPLKRDVGCLGPYYYLAPFIKQYLNLPWVKHESSGQLVTAEEFKKDEAQKLIEKFQELRLDLPRDIDKRTAAAQIGRMVYVAATTKDSTSKRLYEDGLESDELDDKIVWINNQLAKLVDEVDAAITKDREYVQQFGGISRLANWSDGTEPLNASARSILNMASEREVTVPIDQVYSLMGILGVRFPVFPAEGPQKALCRLLDEVVITSSDVSVFNWSGRQSGSSIRGRSLYPRSIGAFQSLMDNPSLQAQATISRGIIRLFQNERYHQAKRADAVNRCLDNFVQRTDAVGKQDQLLAPLKDLVEAIWANSFDCVANHLIDLNKVVKDLDEVIKGEKKDKEEVIKRQKKDKELRKQARREKKNTPPMEKPASDTSTSPSKTGFSYETAESFMNYSVPDAFHVPTLPSFGLKWKTEKPSKDKMKPETTEQAAGGVPTQDSESTAPLLGQSEVKDAENKDSKAEVTETEITESQRQDQTTDTSTLQPDPKARELEWKELRKAVENLTKKIGPDCQSDKEADPPLDHGPEDQTPAEKDAQERAPGSNSSDTKMVCPNPIVVSSAGIRGVFDIQRVVIGMQQRDILRTKIYNSFPGQQIEGSCTISTGFSLMLVKFMCSREILEQQLDVTEVIDKQLSQKLNSKGDDTSHPLEPKSDSSQHPENISHGENPKASGEAATDKKHPMETAPEVQKNRDPKDRSREGEDIDESVEQTYGGEWNQGQQRVHRIIKLVQEDDLHAVAGEWVLARFSDVVGADWFLCRLELGSTDDFYARRIPTDAINFHDAVPESGLVDHWQAYMTEHKHLMCEYLSMFLQSRIKFLLMGNEVESWMPFDGQNDGTGKIPTGMEVFQAVRQGVSGAKYNVMAKYLGGIMEDEAIRSVPTKLRPAVRKMKKGGTLFPMMYHPSKHVHMF